MAESIEPKWYPSTFLKNFEYEPLDTSEQTLRLFCLYRHSSGFILGELKHFKIREAPAYRALSYTWGPAAGSETIRVNARPFSIRPNLFSFLEVYKTRHLGGWLWVDQICINQATTAEPNHQVQLMSQIYRGAEEVIVWLNPEEPEESPDELQCNAECRRSGHARQLKICTWLRALYQHEYWKRVWIIQELLLATSLTVWYGTEILTWPQIKNFPKPGNSASRLYLIIDAAARFKERPLSLSFVIAQFTCGSKCEDPRDQVYGLQALVRENQRLEVDYSKAALDVWLDTVARETETWEASPKSARYLAWAMGLSVARSYGSFDGIFAVACAYRSRKMFTRHEVGEEVRKTLALAAEWREEDVDKWVENQREKLKIGAFEWKVFLENLW